MVIPCYKNDEFLGEALESVFAQTRRLVEIVVIDDGSPEPLTCPWVGVKPEDFASSFFCSHYFPDVIICYLLVVYSIPC